MKLLYNEFSTAFKQADEVLLCPIYSAGEKNDKSINDFSFANLIIKNSKRYLPWGVKIEAKEELLTVMASISLVIIFCKKIFIQFLFFNYFRLY